VVGEVSDQATFSSVAVLSTGTEILQGLYADTNARFLASQVSAAGLEVKMIAAAPDDEIRLEHLLRFACEHAELVICTGGLGPTEDDVNRNVFSRVFERRLIPDESAIEMMKKRFHARGSEMPERNSIQAMIPEGAVVFYNEWGTAPGFFLPAIPGSQPPLGCSLMAMPGPPGELLPMYRKYAVPLIRQLGRGHQYTRTCTIHSFGRPESDLNECVRDLFRANPEVTLTILAKTYGVDFRVTAHARTENRMNELLSEYCTRIQERVGDRDIYGRDDETLAHAVACHLLQARKTVCCAESCTGGLISKLLTDIPGSSDYLKEGFVTYSNESKMKRLGVNAETLERFGAVSAETAREMAEGAKRVSNSDFALSVTGIAGPSGGTSGKPVGLTFIACADDEKTVVERYQFLNDRIQNRTTAALSALNMLRQRLLQQNASA
jgi:nicotinamide-nucleotide amidase